MFTTPRQLSPDQLAGTHTTLEGSAAKVTRSGESFQVDSADTVCGQVRTANATVRFVDAVLMPAG